jgi:hypothetical protein
MASYRETNPEKEERDMTITRATESEIQKAIADLDSWTVENSKLHR